MTRTRFYQIVRDTAQAVVSTNLWAPTYCATPLPLISLRRGDLGPYRWCLACRHQHHPDLHPRRHRASQGSDLTVTIPAHNRYNTGARSLWAEKTPSPKAEHQGRLAKRFLAAKGRGLGPRRKYNPEYKP